MQIPIYAGLRLEKDISLINKVSLATTGVCVFRALASAGALFYFRINLMITITGKERSMQYCQRNKSQMDADRLMLPPQYLPLIKKAAIRGVEILLERSADRQSNPPHGPHAPIWRMGAVINTAKNSTCYKLGELCGSCYSVWQPLLIDLHAENLPPLDSCEIVCAVVNAVGEEMVKEWNQSETVKDLSFALMYRAACGYVYNKFYASVSFFCT